MPTALPQSNARLLSITGPGFSADADEPATAGTPKWEGSADAYVREQTLTSTARGTLDLIGRTSIIIPGDLRPPVALKVGDSLAYDYAGQSFTRKVLAWQTHLLSGVPSTVKLDLEDS